MAELLPKVVITNRVHDDVIQLLASECEVVANMGPDPWPCDVLVGHTRDAVGMMAFMTDCVDRKFLSRCPNLRIIASVLKGCDNLDVEACTESGVWIAIVRDGLTVATAELTIGLMLALSRHIVSGDFVVRHGYSGWRPIFYGTGLFDSTVGILGMGAIGQAVATRLGPFSCRVLYFDIERLPPEREAALGVQYAPFDELVGSSDFVVVAVPLTEGTRHLINADVLRRAKSGCRLVNTARGSIVDEDAVADALSRGRLGGYAADVFEMEDWARGDRPTGISPRLLRERDRTVLTPHLGSAESRVRHLAEIDMANSILDCLKGRRPRGAINTPCGCEA